MPETRAQSSGAAAPTPKKQIFLVRHGEGTHNATGDGSKVDPQLTAYGEAQAAALRGHKHLSSPELIIVSPLSRAVQTAVGVFGEKPAARTVLSPLHTERWSAKCDEGRCKSELLAQFPFLASWEGLDALTEHWTPTRQSDQRWQSTRVPAFIDFLRAQPETNIVVVGHGAYFAHPKLANRHLANCEVCRLTI